MAPFEITWESQEFEYREKNVSWYWTSIVVAVFVLAFAVWQRNFLFGGFVIIAEIMLLVWAEKKPRIVACKLDEKGLAIGDQKTYLNEDMQSFSVSEDPEGDWSTITLRFKRRLKPTLAVRVPRAQRETIEKTFRSFLEETEPETTLLDALEKFFRF